MKDCNRLRSSSISRWHRASLSAATQIKRSCNREQFLVIPALTMALMRGLRSFFVSGTNHVCRCTSNQVVLARGVSTMKPLSKNKEWVERIDTLIGFSVKSAWNFRLLDQIWNSIGKRLDWFTTKFLIVRLISDLISRYVLIKKNRNSIHVNKILTVYLICWLLIIRVIWLKSLSCPFLSI